MIETVLDYLRAGDIYQANISTRFVAPRPARFSAPAAYLALRARSPAPFASYLDLGEGCALLSASPERFVQCDSDGRVETRPIKGTAPRAADRDQDRRNGEALAASAKDRAENLMICDLLRNDLSKVAEEGSVTVMGRKPEPGPDLAMVFQSARLLPWRTVSGMSMRRTPRTTEPINPGSRAASLPTSSGCLGATDHISDSALATRSAKAV